MIYLIIILKTQRSKIKVQRLKHETKRLIIKILMLELDA